MNEQAAQLRQMRIDRTLAAPNWPPRWVMRAQPKSSGMYGLPPIEYRAHNPHPRAWLVIGTSLLAAALFIAAKLRYDHAMQTFPAEIMVIGLMLFLTWSWQFFGMLRYNRRLATLPECATLIFQPGEEQLMLIPRLHHQIVTDTATLVLREVIAAATEQDSVKQVQDIVRIPLILLHSASPTLFQTTIAIPIDALPSIDEGLYQLQWGLEIERTMPSLQIDRGFFLIWVTPHKGLQHPD